MELGIYGLKVYNIIPTWIRTRFIMKLLFQIFVELMLKVKHQLFFVNKQFSKIINNFLKSFSVLETMGLKNFQRDINLHIITEISQAQWYIFISYFVI